MFVVCCLELLSWVYWLLWFILFEAMFVGALCFCGLFDYCCIDGYCVFARCWLVFCARYDLVVCLHSDWLG